MMIQDGTGDGKFAEVNERKHLVTTAITMDDGTFVSVDGSDVPIVGVLPPGFYFPEPGTRIYRPM